MYVSISTPISFAGDTVLLLSLKIVRLKESASMILRLLQVYKTTLWKGNWMSVFVASHFPNHWHVLFILKMCFNSALTKLKKIDVLSPYDSTTLLLRIGKPEVLLCIRSKILNNQFISLGILNRSMKPPPLNSLKTPLKTNMEMSKAT